MPADAAGASRGSAARDALPGCHTCAPTPTALPVRITTIQYLYTYWASLMGRVRRVHVPFTFWSGGTVSLT